MKIRRPHPKKKGIRPDTGVSLTPGPKELLMPKKLPGVSALKVFEVLGTGNGWGITGTEEMVRLDA